MLLRLLLVVTLVVIKRARGVPAPARVADPYYLLREMYQGPVDSDDPALVLIPEYKRTFNTKIKILNTCTRKPRTQGVISVSNWRIRYRRSWEREALRGQLLATIAPRSNSTQSRATVRKATGNHVTDREMVLSPVSLLRAYRLAGALGGYGSDRVDLSDPAWQVVSQLLVPVAVNGFQSANLRPDDYYSHREERSTTPSAETPPSLPLPSPTPPTDVPVTSRIALTTLSDEPSLLSRPIPMSILQSLGFNGSAQLLVETPTEPPAEESEAEPTATESPNPGQTTQALAPNSKEDDFETQQKPTVGAAEELQEPSEGTHQSIEESPVDTEDTDIPVDYPVTLSKNDTDVTTDFDGTTIPFFGTTISYDNINTESIYTDVPDNSSSTDYSDMTTEYTNGPDIAAGFSNIPNTSTEYTNAPNNTTDFISIAAEYTNTPSIATEYTDTTSIATEYTNTLSIAAEYTDTTSIATEYTNTPSIATEYTDTTSIATKYTNTPSIATAYTDTTSIATEYTNTLSIAAEYTDTTSIATEYTNTPSIATEYTDTTSIATEYTDTTSIATEYTDTTSIATEYTDTTSIATEYTDTTSIATEYTDTTSIATEYTDTTSIATEYTDTTSIVTEYSDTPSMSTGYTDTPSISTEYTDIPRIATGYTETPSIATEYTDTPSISIGYTDAPSISTEYTDIPRIATEYTDTPSIATGYTDALSIATEYTDIPRIATEYTDTPSIATGYTDTPSISTEYTDIPSIGTEYTDTPSIFTEYINTPSMSTEYTDIPRIATEYTDTPSIATGYTDALSIATEYTDIPRIATEYTDTPSIATRYTDTPSISTEYTDIPSIGTEYTDTPSIFTEYINTPSMSTGYTDTPSIAIEYTDTSNIATEYTDKSSMSTGYTNTPSMSTEYTDTPSISNEYTDTPSISNEYTDTPSISTEYTDTPSISTEYTGTPSISTEYTDTPSKALATGDIPSTSKMSFDLPSTTNFYTDISIEFTDIAGIFSTNDEYSEYTGVTYEYDNTAYDNTVLSTGTTTYMTTETANMIPQTNSVTENFNVVAEQASVTTEVPSPSAESTVVIKDRDMSPEENSSVSVKHEITRENVGTTTEVFTMMSTDLQVSTDSAERITVHSEMLDVTHGFDTTAEGYDIIGTYEIEAEVPEVTTRHDHMSTIIDDLTIDDNDKTTENPELPTDGTDNPIANVVITTGVLIDTMGTSTEKTIHSIVRGTDTSEDNAITTAEPTMILNTIRDTLTPSYIEMTTKNISSVSESTIYTSYPTVAFHHPSESNIYANEGAKTPNDAMTDKSVSFAEVTTRRGQTTESTEWEGVRDEQDLLGQGEGAFGQEEEEEPLFHAVLPPPPSTERINPDVFANLFFPGNPQDSRAPAKGTIVDLFDIRNPLRPAIRPPFPDLFGLDGPLLRPDLQLVSCDDGNNECIHWARGGGCACAPGRARRQCEWQMYVQETCPRSCGLCP
ncbi:mucin-2-like [Penaeus indicus]|uniref:mucin-2-like n=1 Tax=Penaeus indicus TaxID=29960 RepID=UPI00300D1A0A